MPMVKIKHEDLLQISNFASRKALSLFEVANQIDVLTNIEEETKRKIKKNISLILTHTKLAKEKSVKMVILKFLQDFGYQKFLLDKNDEQSIIFIRQIFDKIDDFEKSFDDKSVKNFINLIDMEIESGEEGSLSKELEEGPEAVKVMTIHSAKGLEFKYVFIVNLVDKRFPSIERSDPIELPDALVKEKIPEGDVHLQEERRLFYVAMTRAKTGLFFTSAENYGGTQKKKLSRFLFEVGLREDVIPIRQLAERNLAEINNTMQIQTRSLVSPIAIGLPRDDKNTAKHFSFSSLKAYETCPYQYYLANILRIPIIGKAQFSFGKTMHSTLQSFFSLIKEKQNLIQGGLFGEQKLETGDQKLETKLPELDDLLNFYKESWIDDWYDDKIQKEKYRELGEKSLRGIYDQLKIKGVPQIFALEKGFHFKLENYTIKGVIDRVDKIGDKVEIIDYKTGGAKTEKTIEKDQLLIYQMATTETFNWQIEKMSYHYLDDNSKVSFLGDENDLQKQKEKIIETIEKINSNDFSATPGQHKCKYCDFVSICKFRKL
jgi:DNA helicase-2/ATP-dependent DNA helicase PcrA